jgi:hypothetical protein
MQVPAGEPGKEIFGNVPGPGIPDWEKAIRILIVFYIIFVLRAFWYLGWKKPGFPL